MTALRGKMAWCYLCNESLWAKYARSRFVIGGKGSHLWKTISPFITNIAHDCHWRIGDGSTNVGVFCSNLAMPFPKRLQHKSIKVVLTSPELRRVLFQNVHPRIYLSTGGVFVEGVPDKLLWDKDTAGFVTAKSFLKTFAQNEPIIRNFEVIWQSWIPLKVSCFLWRCLHVALATNDNVMRVGILMASNCICCILPKCESMDHLFFYSDMAAILWDFLCPIFRKPRPISFSSFVYDWGVSSNFKKFADCLGFGIACLCLWEIWKLRNERIYDDRFTKFSRRYIFSRAGPLAKIIPMKCTHDLHSRLICHALLIQCPPIREFRVFWSIWMPHKVGLTCNLAFHVSDQCSSMAAIVRDAKGSLILGFKTTSVMKHFLKCIFHLLNEIKVMGVPISCIQASNEDILLLDRSMIVDWSLFQIKRKLANMLGDICVHRVSFSLNKPAEALCYANIKCLKSNLPSDLPSEVLLALDEDALPKPCSLLDQMIYL